MDEFKAYFDESGCHQASSVLAVGGYLVRVDRARRMERKWKAALNRYGLPHFHMVEIAHGNGACRALSKSQRIELQKRMIELIEGHAALGFVTVANPKRFSEIAPLPDLYTFCVNACLMGICAWFCDKPEAKIEFIFEAGHANGKRANQYLMQHRQDNDPDIGRVYQSHRFANKANVPLLQAADLLVWHSAKFVRDKVSQDRPPRADFKRLIKHKTVFAYTVLQNNTLALSFDNSPELAEPQRDAYVKAMFESSPSADKIVTGYHEQFSKMNSIGIVTGKLGK